MSPDDLAEIERMHALAPEAGLAGRWEGGDEFADRIDEIVAQRTCGMRVVR